MYFSSQFIFMKKGVLLVNLGSPDTTKTKDVRKYLDEFLMDERVIDLPYWKRYIIIRGIVLNTRPKKTAEAYKKIWLKEGSPLIVFSQRFTEKITKKIDIPIALGMRYGSMSIQNAIQELVDQNVKEILLVPLYPQDTMSSFETVVEKTKTVINKSFSDVKLDVFPAFYNKQDYINVMSSHLKEQLHGFDYDHILFSYHGIPEHHIVKVDPKKLPCNMENGFCSTHTGERICYRNQCLETTKAIVKKLGIKEDEYSNAFQSRMLKDPWLEPFTDVVLEKLPKKGKKKLVVVTPSFVSDCLETLEEIAIRGKKDFIAFGGENLKHISCLNDNDNWVDVMVGWIEEWRN